LSKADIGGRICGMNYVIHRYRNVVNPWQTRKDIEHAIFFIAKMENDHPKDDFDVIMNSDNNRGPDRVW
jgi:hypothetical protein